MTEETRACRPRFKGIENFLRRVAFNLGNTPSQTEVKIISCIPIDVTDLQHKIITLERELEDSRRDPLDPRGGASVINTALVSPQRPTYHSTPGCASSGCARPYTPPGCAGACPSIGVRATNPPSCASSKKKSSVSFVCPGLIHSGHRDDDCEEDCDRLRNLINKVKKIRSGKRKDRCNTQLVYYAQTTNSPFTIETAKKGSKELPLKEAMSRTYLCDMVRKQYRPDRMAEELSQTSQFSRPICRDAAQSCDGRRPYDSDICSCCRGQFCNVDYTTKPTYDVFTAVPAKRNEGVNSTYYDSSLYDLVPVREKPTKTRNAEISPKRKDSKNQMVIRSYPERGRVRTRFQPYAVNCYTAAYLRGTRKSGYKRKLPVRSPSRIAPKKKYEQQRQMESSNTCSVDCGRIYSKPLYGNRGSIPPKSPIPKVTEHVKPQPVLQKNAECLTLNVNSTECQTASSKSVQLEPQPPDENKTEETLNQIKSILQSVLTEVKTSSQIKSVSDETSRKDAVVQKGTSQSNIQTCSSLMNSFSYSPYNMNPYVPSCSRQGNNQLYYPGTSYPPVRCLQNYPLFIQTTGRQCACCIRNIPAAARSTNMTRQATTAATNTEALVPPQRSKETDKLIKEIYKSIAINMDYPTKDTSNSEGEGLKSANNSNKIFEFKFIPKDVPSKGKEVSSEETRKKVQDTSTMPTFTTFGSNVGSNAASSQSQPVGKPEARSKRIDSYMVTKEMRIASGSERERERKHVPYVVELPNGTSYSDDTDTPESDEVESDDTVVPAPEPVKKKEKNGLFSKMVKIFKPKQKKQEKEEIESESEEEPYESEASDSDDYETVYSQQSRKPTKHVTYMRDRPRYKKPHSKVSFSKYYMRRDRSPEKRRSPYMEQEYRRYWNENLAFHGGSTPRYSSERPFSRDSVPRAHRNPPFWQNYDARNMGTTVLPPGYSPGIVEVEKNALVDVKNPSKAAKGLAWFKKHKLGVPCGEQWKKFILEG